ncbi:MAG: M20/M25/M40 family metallo-hydrolase [Reyranellaceae bacterium]
MIRETKALLQADPAAGATMARALAAIARGADDAVDELARLIAVDTSFPPGDGYAAFADLMQEITAPLGFAHRRVVVPEALWRGTDGPPGGPRINLLATRRTGKPACGLYFHVDTVPAAPGWRRDPLRLVREDQRLYGLGAADMKGTIAAALLALRAAAECGVALAYDPMLLFCTDEEGGLYPGVRYLAEQGLLEGHIINFNGSAAPRIWAGCFGLFNLMIRIRGEAVHAGAGAGINAIEQALPLLGALRDLKPIVAQRRSSLPPPPQANGPLTAQLTIASAHGGGSGGQIPALFEIVVNRRYPPEERFEDALAEIDDTVRAAVRTAGGLTVETSVIGHLIPTEDPTGPHWPRWQQALALGFGYAWSDFRKWGAASCSDFGYVQRTGMREVLLGGLARPERNIHGPDEHTTVHDIVALARSVLAYLAADFAADLNPDRSLA